MVSRFFQLDRLGTDVRTEVVAGVTTFMTMAYIIVVNPAILSAAGMDKGAVTIATCLSSAIAALVMGFLANYPYALAPGMGINAIFAFTAVPLITRRLGDDLTVQPWQVALGIVFLSGLIFLILTLTRVRESVINAIPISLKSAVAIGIGLLLTFYGTIKAGLIADDPAIFVSMSRLATPEVFRTVILALIGLLVMGVLMAKGVKGAILIGIILVALLYSLPWFKTGEPVGVIAHPSLSPTFFKLNVFKALNWGFASLIFTFFLIDFFDTAGTVIGLSQTAGYVDEKGRIPRVRRVLFADAVGTIIGSLLGTSTVTSYIESAAGIEEGGRSGLTAIIVAILFLVALLAVPLVGLIPDVATAPAIILVGLFMMKSVTAIDFKDPTEAIPAFVTFTLMPFTFAIAKAIGFGIISYTILKVATGKGRAVHPIMYGLSVLFILFYALSPIFK